MTKLEEALQHVEHAQTCLDESLAAMDRGHNREAVAHIAKAVNRVTQSVACLTLVVSRITRNIPVVTITGQDR